MRCPTTRKEEGPLRSWQPQAGEAIFGVGTRFTITSDTNSDQNGYGCFCNSLCCCYGLGNMETRCTLVCGRQAYPELGDRIERSTERQGPTPGAEMGSGPGVVPF
eukprot:3563668-Rhodomonas_salina.2